MRNAECEMRNVTDLKDRTKIFVLEVIQLVRSLPNNLVIDIIKRQLLRSVTSVGANYRSACRARSRADFISKIGIVEEEADETVYWLELLLEMQICQFDGISSLLREANELVAIFTSSGRTAKGI